MSCVGWWKLFKRNWLSKYETEQQVRIENIYTKYSDTVHLPNDKLAG